MVTGFHSSGAAGLYFRARGERGDALHQAGWRSSSCAPPCSDARSVSLLRGGNHQKSAPQHPLRLAKESRSESLRFNVPNTHRSFPAVPATGKTASEQGVSCNHSTCTTQRGTSLSSHRSPPSEQPLPLSHLFCPTTQQRNYKPTVEKRAGTRSGRSSASDRQGR